MRREPSRLKRVEIAASALAIVSLAISRLLIVNTRIPVPAIIPPVRPPYPPLLACIALESYANERTICRTRLQLAHTPPTHPSRLIPQHEIPRYRRREGDSVSHLVPLVPRVHRRRRRRRAVCDSPLPRGANYIVRNANLVCQAVSTRGLALPPSMLRVHP